MIIKLKDVKKRSRIKLTFADGTFATGVVMRKSDNMIKFRRGDKSNHEFEIAKDTVIERFGQGECYCFDCGILAVRSYCAECYRKRNNYKPAPELQKTKDDLMEFAIQYNKEHKFKYSMLKEFCRLANDALFSRHAGFRDCQYLREREEKSARKWYEKNKHKFGKKLNSLLKTEVCYE